MIKKKLTKKEINKILSNFDKNFSEKRKIKKEKPIKCRFCKVNLESYTHIDMHTPFGVPLTPSYYYCPKCGLMYKKVKW